jgi:hypothetical protein
MNTWTLSALIGYSGLLTFIIWPLLKGAKGLSEGVTSSNFVLTDQKDRLVQMLKDLQLEKELGTISEADYEEGFNSLSSELSQILALLDNGGDTDVLLLVRVPPGTEP